MASKGKDDGDDRDDDENDNDTNKRYASKLPNRKYGFFRDDQVSFLVTHEHDQISDEQLKDFERAITPRLKDLGVGILKSEAISFPRFPERGFEQNIAFLSKEEVKTVGKAFSIIKCDLQDAPNDPVELIKIVKKLIKRPPQSSEELTIQGTSLNWLSSVASNGAGTGGPGGKPSPYYGNRKNAPYCFDIITQLQNKKIYGDGAGVDIAILDTAPCAQDLVAAYKEWPDHPIIATLLGSNGKLHLYPATYDELLRLGSTSLNNHDYKMTDHGLFIAGIIHSIVPEAEIHLIEVLNQYGVGDISSFARGLQIVSEKIYKSDRKLAINCSWMLEFPLEDRHWRYTDCVGDLDAEFARAVLRFSGDDEIKGPTQLMLEFLFNQFFDWGRQAFAAAGNDGKKKDKTRVQARYPAALKHVTGVGALPKTLERTGGRIKKYRPSVFSNLSEQPNYKGVVDQGVLTLGGEEGEGNGVLGLYIGEFPGCCRNESKWAWWAGTSFATPILTGAVAAVLSRKANNITTTQEAIQKLLRVKIILDGKGGTQEDALPVTQS